MVCKVQEEYYYSNMGSRVENALAIAAEDLKADVDENNDIRADQEWESV